jgi:hypothetical protein
MKDTKITWPSTRQELASAPVAVNTIYYKCLIKLTDQKVICIENIANKDEHNEQASMKSKKCNFNFL